MNKIRRDVSLRFLDDEGFLFDSSVQKLYLANRSAAFVWCCFDEGLSPDDAVRQLQETFGLSSAIAKAYIQDAIGEWTRLGLLENTCRDSVAKCDPDDSLFASLCSESGDYHHKGTVEPFAERTCRLLDTHFAIRFGSETTVEELDSYLVPLATNETPNATLAIEVVANGRLRALVHKGRIIGKWGTPDEIVPMLKLGLIRLAMEQSLDFGALHAAAVCRDDGGPCVLLPGPSGVGKSTLTAALLSEGFHSLGDDTIVLARNTLDVRAVPFGICLKSGAWKLLATRFPRLLEQPIHSRLDGKRVRYLIPDTRRSDVLEKPRPAAWMVFPRPVNGGRSELVPLARADALSRLATQFCPFGRGLDLQKLDQLIDWVRGIACYELRCASLEGGIDLIATLWK